MKDRVTLLCILLVLQVVQLECARGGEITTKFENNATLTDQQVQSVIQLARECGLTEPAEVSIGHTRPLNRRFIIVRSIEQVDGRRKSYERVDVCYSAWIRVSPHGSAKRVGDFWANPPYRMKMQFATFQVGGKLLTIQMSDEITLQTADTIVDAFVTKKFRFGQGSHESLDGARLREPSWLTYDKRTKEYKMAFGALMDYEVWFELTGGQVVIQNVRYIDY